MTEVSPTDIRITRRAGIRFQTFAKDFPHTPNLCSGKRRCTHLIRITRAHLYVHGRTGLRSPSQFRALFLILHGLYAALLNLRNVHSRYAGVQRHHRQKHPSYLVYPSHHFSYYHPPKAPFRKFFCRFSKNPLESHFHSRAGMNRNFFHIFTHFFPVR